MQVAPWLKRYYEQYGYHATGETYVWQGLEIVEMKKALMIHSLDEESSNIERLPIMKRDIASVFIISRDNKVLLGLKEKDGGGVWSDESWHIPGGGFDSGVGDATIEDTAVREVWEETGIEITKEQLGQVKDQGQGATAKIVDGVRYWCEMKFNRFVVHIDENAVGVRVPPEGGDLIELKWFDEASFRQIKQIPGAYDPFSGKILT